MGDKLKSLGSIAFGIAAVIAVFAIPVVFFFGVTWAARNLMEPLIIAGWVALALDFFILMPLAIFKATRGFAGSGIFISSYVFGLLTWLLSFIVTWELWGGWAVIAGILLFGGAVVPFALLASLFKGAWDIFFFVLGLFILTFGSRIGGLAIAGSSDK